MKQIDESYVDRLEYCIKEAVKNKDKYAFIDPAYDIVDEISELDNAIDYLEPLLSLIERSPAIDFGGPGPIGTFIETFYKNGYEEELVKSLLRKPRIYTVFLLRRLLRDPTLENVEFYSSLLNSIQPEEIF